MNFIKKVFNVFGDLFIDTVNQTFNNRSKLPLTMRVGLISLINKTENNLDSLDNWRPITLLNVDYKIVAKVMASRLRRVLDKLVVQSRKDP